MVSWNEAAEMNDSVASEALVMPSRTGSNLAGMLVLGRQLGVLLDHADALDLLAVQELGVAGVGDLDLAQHLANDHLDVLVVDLHALQAVHVLDFLDQVGGQRLDAEQAQDVLRIRLAVHHGLALLHVLAFEHDDLAVLRDQLFVLVAVGVLDDQALLALGVLAEADDARDARPGSPDPSACALRTGRPRAADHR